jgi:hypothetical protein
VFDQAFLVDGEAFARDFVVVEEAASAAERMESG